MSTALKTKVNPLIISKITFLLYIVYSNVTSHALFFVRGLSSILLVGSFLIILFYDGFKFIGNKSLISLIVFAVYIHASGIIVAINYNQVLVTASIFIESLLVFYLIIRYIRIDQTPTFVMSVFIIQAIVAASIMISQGTGLYRISIAENVNVNTLGVMFAFAIGFTLYLIIENGSPKKIAIGVPIVFLMLFGIMLTASKKGILAAAAFIVLWIVLCYKWTFAKMNKLLRIGIFIILIAISAYIYRWFTQNYTDQLDYVMYRMSMLYVGESDQARAQLIKEGFSIFLSHPLLGVGFNNARYYTSLNTYTHCFYSELFACTGIVGVIIFGYALFRPGYIIVNKIRTTAKRLTIARTQIRYMFVIFLILLALCLAQIIFYMPNLMYVYAIVTGFAGLSIEQISSGDSRNE